MAFVSLCGYLCGFALEQSAYQVICFFSPDRNNIGTCRVFVKLLTVALHVSWKSIVYVESDKDEMHS